MFRTAIGSGLALTAANFVFEVLTSSNWARACEHSFFELMGIVALLIALNTSKISRTDFRAMLAEDARDSGVKLASKRLGNRPLTNTSAL